MDYERLAYCCRERSKREGEDITQITLNEAATAITDLLSRCKRLDESRERANESAHMWESRCKMLEERAEKAERERDDLKAALKAREQDE